MTTRSRLSFVLLLALGACGDSTTGDDSGQNPDDPPQQPDPERTMDATGTYRIHSTFDIATNMPGTSGTFVNGLISATDGPDDPMAFVLDQIIATLPAGAPKTALQAVEPFVAGYLNGKLTALAPQLVGTFTNIGHRLADLTKHFGLAEKLVVTVSDQQLVGDVTADGLRFVVDGTTIDSAFAANNIDDVTASVVHVSYEMGRLGIGDHTLALPYGKIVRIGLDVAIIPAIDPNAHGLADLLDDLVDCHGVGQELASSVGVGSAAFWESACHTGLVQAANYLYGQIADGTLDFHLLGNARASDSNDDYKLDKLTFGEWSGMMTYSGTDAALAQPATFEGARL